MKKPIRVVAADTAEDEINLTPMLDVVFIMLIFFVVTASFITESGIEASRSEEQTPIIEVESRAILVEILAGDEILINGLMVDFRAVRANLEQLHAVNPEHPLVIHTAAASTTQALVNVLDAAELAEIGSVSVGPL